MGKCLLERLKNKNKTVSNEQKLADASSLHKNYKRSENSFEMQKVFDKTLLSYHFSKFKGIVKQAFPFAIITILYSVHDKVDQVMLERMLPEPNGAHETGLYAGAYRWVDAVSMYLWTVLPIFFARFASKIHSPKAQTQLLEFGQAVAAIPMIFVSVFVVKFDAYVSVFWQ